LKLNPIPSAMNNTLPAGTLTIDGDIAVLAMDHPLGFITEVLKRCEMDLRQMPCFQLAKWP